MGDEYYIRPGLGGTLQGLSVPRVEPPALWSFGRPPRRWFNSPVFHCLLLFLTFLTTLIVGVHIALNYEHNFPAFDWDISRAFFAGILYNPATLKLGIPFSLTLLSILLAHEMGHYFTCRYYGIQASYPYFIPAPTLIGTMGAFIRIKTPITTRRALFDIGISGPLAGFIVAIPALIVAILNPSAGADKYPGHHHAGKPAYHHTSGQNLTARLKPRQHFFAAHRLCSLGGIIRYRSQSASHGATRRWPHFLCCSGREAPDCFAGINPGTGPTRNFLLGGLDSLGCRVAFYGSSSPVGNGSFRTAR